MIWLKFRIEKRYLQTADTAYFPLLEATNSHLYERGGFTWIFYKKPDPEGNTYYFQTDHGDLAEMVAKKMPNLEVLDSEPNLDGFTYDCGGGDKDPVAKT